MTLTGASPGVSLKDTAVSTKVLEDISMAKYIVRYLIFWLPATIIFYFFNNSSMLSQVLQWFFAFFMLLGWSVNTGMAAYYYPRKVLALIFGYAGVNILLIVAWYKTYYHSALNNFLLYFGGLFSYNPLDVFIQALLDFNIYHELFVTGFLVLCCVIAYIVAMVYRHFNPNPYRPRILKTR